MPDTAQLGDSKVEDSKIEDSPAVATSEGYISSTATVCSDNGECGRDTPYLETLYLEVAPLIPSIQTLESSPPVPSLVETCGTCDADIEEEPNEYR